MQRPEYRSVWKFPLEATDEQSIDMPDGAEILCVQMQGSMPTLWALVDPLAPKVARHFRVAGTGHAIKTFDLPKYIGTFQLAAGSLVFHVFEVTPLPVDAD